MKSNDTKDDVTAVTSKPKNAIDRVENPLTREYLKVMYDQLAKFKAECACTSSAMSEKLNKSSGYFSKIESRKAFPSMETFLDFCVVCKVSPMEFFDVTFEYSYRTRALEEKLLRLDEKQFRLINDLVDNMLEHNVQVTPAGESDSKKDCEKII